MINAEEKEEEIPQGEQKEQVPMRDVDETNLDNNQTFPRLQDEPSETDYQTIGTTRYKTHAKKNQDKCHIGGNDEHDHGIGE